MTPPAGLYFSNQMYFYTGSISGNVPFDGGSLAGDARIRAAVMIPTFLLVTPVEIANGRLGISLTTPYGNVDVSGHIGPLRSSDNRSTFADPSIGVFLGWKEGQFHWQVGATAFLPVGDYRKGALANIAKHRGALDVFGTLTWVEPTLALDVSNVVGVTFNQENEATNYRTGTEFHWEWSIAHKFSNGFSIGPAGYYYKSFTEDSGSGAILGAFQGGVFAIGAGVGYEFKLGDLPVTARLRYFNEIYARNRLNGSATFAGVSFPLWVSR